jgi:hypothetical protein
MRASSVPTDGWLEGGVEARWVRSASACESWRGGNGARSRSGARRGNGARRGDGARRGNGLRRAQVGIGYVAERHQPVTGADIVAQGPAGGDEAGPAAAAATTPTTAGAAAAAAAETSAAAATTPVKTVSASTPGAHAAWGSGGPRRSGTARRPTARSCAASAAPARVGTTAGPPGATRRPNARTAASPADATTATTTTAAAAHDTVDEIAPTLADIGGPAPAAARVVAASGTARCAAVDTRGTAGSAARGAAHPSNIDHQGLIGLHRDRRRCLATTTADPARRRVSRPALRAEGVDRYLIGARNHESMRTRRGE